jgi:hypothetical protein
VTRTIFFAAAFALIGVARDADAAAPIELEAGVKVGGATKPPGDANPLGFGAGGRIGVGAANVWFGFSAMHYIGSSGETESERFASTSTTFTSTLIGFELGYTLKAIPFLFVRPQLALGDDIVHASATDSHLVNGPSIGTASTSSSTDTGVLYVEPGVTLLVPLSVLFVAADVNALVVLGSQNVKGFASVAAGGQIGIRL